MYKNKVGIASWFLFINSQGFHVAFVISYAVYLCFFAPENDAENHTYFLYLEITSSLFILFTYNTLNSYQNIVLFTRGAKKNLHINE